ncbi:class I glutamine amidotransferase-like protein [Cytidiella melzeri]|nr:class I glutamine amidotransferase-like protein [Cytidiella melzeri]
MAPTPLSLAVCLFPRVTPSDYQNTIELFSFLSPQVVASGLYSTPPDVTIEATYLGVTSEPIHGDSGPRLLPNKTYGDVKEGEQFDIILVPGGSGTSPGLLPQPVVDFVKKQAPGAKYVLSICTGAEVLAVAGVLNGLRATTSKAWSCLKEDCKDMGVIWDPKARWVVDGKFWSSAGATAGAEMGYTFVKHLVGHENAEVARGVVELSVRGKDDDEFAKLYKLV